MHKNTPEVNGKPLNPKTPKVFLAM